MLQRIPFLDVSTGQATVWIMIMAANALILVLVNRVNELGWETNFGYLAMGNSVLLVVPATRNSVLHLLVCTVEIENFRC